MTPHHPDPAHSERTGNNELDTVEVLTGYSPIENDTKA